MIVQIVRVAGSRSMRAEIAPALTRAAPLSFMFPRLAAALREGLALSGGAKDASPGGRVNAGEFSR